MSQLTHMQVPVTVKHEGQKPTKQEFIKALQARLWMLKDKDSQEWEYFETTSNGDSEFIDSF